MHLAVSPDQFSLVFFQGHPEYDTHSLLKEYKREVNRFIIGEREDYPPYPEHYFNEEAQALANHYQEHVMDMLKIGETPLRFPESQIEPLLENTWRDTAKAIVNNWLGMVYEHTDYNQVRKPKRS